MKLSKVIKSYEFNFLKAFNVSSYDSDKPFVQFLNFFHIQNNPKTFQKNQKRNPVNVNEVYINLVIMVKL
jgi:hypothetical protein